MAAACSVMTDTGRSARRVATPATRAVTSTANGTPIHSPVWSERKLSVSGTWEAWPTRRYACEPMVIVRVTFTSPDGSSGGAPGSTATASTPSGVNRLTAPVPARSPASSWSTTPVTRSRMASRPPSAM